MKFTVNKSALFAELQHLVRVTEKKSTIPILSMVLIEAKDDSIRLIATDLDVTLITTCVADVSAAGSVVLSAKKLFDVVRALPDAEISFQAMNKKTDGVHTTVSCAGSEFKLATQEKEHFPATPTLQKTGVGFSASTLQSLVERTVYAITLEESRYALSGALFESDENALRMVATDGHRLACAEASAVAGHHRRIVPRKALSEIAFLSAARVKELKSKDSQVQAQAQANGEVLFVSDENHMFFQFGERLLISRMLAGQFPKWDLVIPKNNGNVVSLATKEFAHAVTRAALMADERSHGVKLELKKNKLIITAHSADVGEAKEEISVEYKGEPVEIGFNAKYCLEFLNTITTERINFSLNNGESPALFRPDGDDGYRYVVMPMRLL
jgi:DNA polymerase-3 subunit beta